MIRLIQKCLPLESSKRRTGRTQRSVPLSRAPESLTARVRFPLRCLREDILLITIDFTLRNCPLGVRGLKRWTRPRPCLFIVWVKSCTLSVDETTRRT